MASPLTSKNAWAHATRNTPAVTMVAAWMRAETGVGPSIASGNQKCSGNSALFPTTPRTSSDAIAVAVPEPTAGGARPNVRAVVVEATKGCSKIRNIATMKPTSPTRVVMNAFFPALAAAGGARTRTK